MLTSDLFRPFQMDLLPDTDSDDGLFALFSDQGSGDDVRASCAGEADVSTVIQEEDGATDAKKDRLAYIGQ